ncbi:MAG: SCO family protein [Granulosicoccus sp.]
MSRLQGGVLPLLLTGIVALAVGVLAYNKFSPALGGLQSGNDAQARQQESAQLTALQENLQTSLALPLDFRQVSDFQLLDQNGAPLDKSVFENRWSIVFFGYTHCPDVCPITLQTMKNVVEMLKEQNEPEPQVVFVSVDPSRDTSEIMKNYISYFNEDFLGITGDQNEMHKFTRSLGIVASFTANDEEPENYIVDHTASLLVIDPKLRVRAKMSPPHEAETILADYLTIIAAPS